MDLIDRYLAAIGRELPKAQAADISAELRDTLLSAVEDREQQLGCPLGKKELEAVLVGFGNPLVVAARYRKVQYLIGPEIFPFWWAVLRIVFAVVGTIWLAALVIGLASGGSHAIQVLQAMQATVVTGVVFLFGVVTLVFVVLERCGLAKAIQQWKPSSLPPARARRRGRFEVAMEIVAAAVMIAWWTGLIRFRDFMPIPAPIQVTLATTWAPLYWPVLAYYAADIVVNLLELARPARVRLNASLSLAKDIAGASLLVYILRAGHWVQITAAHLPPTVVEKIQAGFDRGMQLGLIATALILGGKAVHDLWRLIRGPSPNGPRSANGPGRLAAGA